MRAGWNSDLKARVRAVDPTARFYFEFDAVESADHKKTKADMEGADSYSGLTVFDDGSVRITGTYGTKIEKTAGAGTITDLDRESPLDVARIDWLGSDGADLEIHRVVAELDPGASNVDKWLMVIYQVVRRDQYPTADGMTVVAIGESEVTAGGVKADVTFGFDAPHPRPKSHIPSDYSQTDSTATPVPVTFVAIYALDANGAAATAGAAWTSGAGSVTTSGNVLSGVRLANVPGHSNVWSQSGGINTPRIRIDTKSFTDAYIEWTTTNPLDLGATPTDTVRFIGRGETPFGTTITYQVRNDADSAWVAYNDGDTTDDLAGVGKNQTYKMRVDLDVNAAGDLTPTLRIIGVEELTTTDLTPFCRIEGGGASIDPLTMKGETAEANLIAIRDGIPDFKDAITNFLVGKHIGEITLRVMLGAPDLTRDKWMLMDEWLVEDIVSSGKDVVLPLVSIMAKLKGIIPTYDEATDTRATLVYNGATLTSVYYNLLQTQLGVGGRFVGPGVEDASISVSKKIKNSDGKKELDAICFVGTGGLFASQGQIKFAPMFAHDKDLKALLTRDSFYPTTVTPGFRYRVPEYFVNYNWNYSRDEFDGEVRRFHAAGLLNLGTDTVDSLRRAPIEACKYLDTATDAIAVGEKISNALGPGLMLWTGALPYAHPELEPGDLVGVETDHFVARDPLSGRALRGAIFARAVVQQVHDYMGKKITVFVRSYADIYTSSETVDRTGYVEPEIISIVPAVSGSGELTVTITTRDARSVKVAASISGFPNSSTVQAATAIPTDEDGAVVSSVLLTLNPGETGYISALAYETVGGTGIESELMSKSRIYNVTAPQQTTEIKDGFATTLNGTESGDVVITADDGAGYSNLEDANNVMTNYEIGYDIDATGLDETTLASVVVYTNDGPASTTWTQVASRTHDALDDLTDQVVGFSAALDVNWDIRVRLEYEGTGSSGATLTLHREAHPTLAGVRYERVDSSVLPETEGGTGKAAYVLGEVLYSDVADSLARLSGNITTNKMFMSQTGTGAASAAPVWAQIAWSDITGGGTVGTDSGGTGQDFSAAAQGSVIVINAIGVMSIESGVTDGDVLTYIGGTDTVAFATPSTGITGSGTAGTIPYFSSATVLADSPILRVSANQIEFDGVETVTIDASDAQHTHLEMYAFLNGPGGSNFIDGYAASTKDAPTAKSYDNQVLIGLAGFGHTGTGYGQGGGIYIRGAADWSASVFSTDIGFYTREGSGAMTERWTIEPGGDLLPFTDSSVAIGSNLLRPTVVYADSFDGPGGSITGLSASNITSGTLGTAYGGTGQDWSAAAQGGVIWTDGVGSFAIAYGVTDGDVLTYTSGTDSVGWATPAAGMGGSGTTTYIPYFSASTTLADSPMYRSSPTLVKTDSDLYVYGPAPDTGGVTSSIIVFAYAGAPAFSGYHSAGTRGSETASANGNWVGLFRGIAHDGTTYSNAAAVLALTEETWSGSAHAAGLRFYTRATGDGDYQPRWLMDQTGHFRPYSESPALNIGSTSVGIATLHVYDASADRVLMRYGSTEIMRMEYGGTAGQQGLLIGSRQNSTAIVSGEGSWTQLIANVEIGQDEVLRLLADSHVRIGSNLQTAWASRYDWDFRSDGRMYFPYAAATQTTAALYGTAATTLQWNGTFRATTLNADDIGAGLVTYAYGGTGQTSWAKGDLLYADAVNSLSKLGAGADGNVLTFDTALGLPKWAAPASHTHTQSQISDTPITVPNGGTGVVTLEDHGVVLGSGTAAVSMASPAVTNLYLAAQGVSADPVFQQITAAHVAAGTFQSGNFTFQGSVLPDAVTRDLGTAALYWQILFVNEIRVVPNGDKADPGYTWNSNQDVGLFYDATNVGIGFTVDNTTGPGGYTPLLLTATVALFSGVGVYSYENDLGDISTAQNIDWQVGNNHYARMTASLTLTLTNYSGKKGMEITVSIGADSSGPYTITWAGPTISWATTQDNTVAALKTNVYQFKYINDTVVGWVISSDTIGVV